MVFFIKYFPLPTEKNLVRRATKNAPNKYDPEECDEVNLPNLMRICNFDQKYELF